MSQLIYQFEVTRAIRKFFDQNNFMDILTPPLVPNPGMETHIHPFKVLRAKDQQESSLYLHTSPEFMLKEVLAKTPELNDIFSIAYSFRDEPNSPIHRSQFIMLEWYRRNAHYSKIMDDCENLISFVQNELSLKNLPIKKQIKNFPRTTIKDLIFDISKLNIEDFLNTKDLKEKLSKDFKEVPLPMQQCSWDDYYFLFFLNIIEPHLKNYPYLLLYEFPAPLSALSTIKEDNPKVCERFEIYLEGVELCNCFNELTNYAEQVHRFKMQAAEKKYLYGYELPWPKRFLETLKSGYPKSSGIALGVERLTQSLFKTEQVFFD